MIDFTPGTYRKLIHALKAQQYNFQTFADYLQQPASKVVLLRYDIDARKWQSLLIAEILRQENIAATFYFRIVKQSFDVSLIRQIAGMGHEIGYHYEDLSLCKGNTGAAIQSFEKNLNTFRQLYPVKTICMHGSPRSPWDNKDLWKHYNYRDYGLMGEPYFDIDFNEMLYLTDTGRRWDGWKVSIRDKVPQQKLWKQKGMAFHTTHDIIEASYESRLPDKIMITIHPQRWTNHTLPWLKELVLQNIKNQIKAILLKKRTKNQF